MLLLNMLMLSPGLMEDKTWSGRRWDPSVIWHYPGELCVPREHLQGYLPEECLPKKNSLPPQTATSPTAKTGQTWVPEGVGPTADQHSAGLLWCVPMGTGQTDNSTMVVLAWEGGSTKAGQEQMSGFSLCHLSTREGIMWWDLELKEVPCTLSRNRAGMMFSFTLCIRGTLCLRTRD